MLLAGDELGHTQRGNNNAYAQDNDTSWLDWSGDDPEFIEQVRELILLRRETPLLRLQSYLHGNLDTGSSSIRIDWCNQSGDIKQDAEWTTSRAFSVLITETKLSGSREAVAVLINGADHESTLSLPALAQFSNWRLAFVSCREDEATMTGLELSLPAKCLALLTAES